MSPLVLVLLIFAASVGLFILNKPRMDMVALLALVLLTLTGVVSLPEALAGFSDPNVVLIAALFVVGEGLVRTGIAHRLGSWLIRRAGSSETRLVALLMLTVAGLGSVMSSTGVVAIFIPVVLGIAHRLGLPPGRLMMPLSFAGLISGMMTLVATPPNMVVDSALKHAGHAGFRFFDFTPIGGVVLIAGVGYMLAVRHWLKARPGAAPGLPARTSLGDLIREYGLATHEQRLRITAGSPLIGRSLEELQARRRYQANVIAIERQGRFRPALVHPRAETKLQAGDILLVDRIDPDGHPAEWPPELAVEPLPLTGHYFMDQSNELGIAEVMVPPHSCLLAKSVRELRFRSLYGLNVIGLRRGSRPLPAPVVEEKLQFGDTLLVVGPWKAIRQLQTWDHDFLLIHLPAEADQVQPARERAPYALLSLGVMVFLMVTGLVPNAIAGLMACLLMGLFGCLDLNNAYKAIRWESLVLIAGIMPFSIALQKTGGVEWVATGLLHLLGGASFYFILAGLFVLTAVAGLFISNTATAILMAPIALSVAGHLGVSPQPFAMTVALAASAAFMTPISSPVNMLVMGPGQYQFADFVKLGVPFTVLVLLITVVLVPWLFPLHLP